MKDSLYGIKSKEALERITPKNTYTLTTKKALKLAQNTYKQNLILLRVILTSKKWSSRIERHRKKKDKSDIDLKKLVNEILDDSGLSRKLFSFYVAWYIQYSKFDAPAYNFLITRKKRSVVVEFFRMPNTYDLRALKLLISMDFGELGKSVSAKIDSRLLKTIQRRALVSNDKNLADLADEVWPDGDLSQDIKRVNIIKKDRQRLRELDKKLGVTDL